MKKSIIAIVLSVFVLGSLGANDAGQSWSRLYRRLPDLKQKYAVIQNLTPLDDRSLEAFYADSLDDLVYGDLSQYRTDMQTYDDWEILTRTIIRELGEIKGQTASETVFYVLRTAEVPLLKAEAYVALGQMRATEYASDIATMLRNLNFNANSDKETAELEAFGAVVALDKMKEGVGFEPLFYASIGWYSDRVTSLADEAVLTLTDNPIPRLTDIMENAADYDDKRAALALGLRTEASTDEKSTMAVAALSEGLRYSESDYTLSRQLANLRSEAIEALIQFSASVDGAPDLLDKAIDEGDMDEKLIALQALGVDGSDAATERLADRLSFYNERRNSGLGLKQDELMIVRQVIYALGETGNQKGLDPLTQMSYLDYTPALIRLAKESINRINGN